MPVDVSSSADSVSKPTGVVTPADALGVTKRMSQSEPDGKESCECPTCGRECASKTGMKIHHSRTHGESIAGDEVTCEVCSETFTTNPNDAEGRKYCSPECSAEGRNKQVETECATCGQSVQKHRCRVERYENVYCSHECQYKSLEGDRPDLRNRVWFECDTCGEEDWKTASKYERSGHDFCSADCRKEFEKDGWYAEGEDHPHHKGRVSITCEWCGETEEKYPSEAERSRFCSPSCRSKSVADSDKTPIGVKGEWVTIECDQCGGEDEIPAWRSDTARFCSRDCRANWMSENYVGERHHDFEGGPVPYGPGFHEAKKEAVRDRDDRRCQHCGKTEAEHVAEHGSKHIVHHIRKARHVDNAEERNAMNNLVTLCRGSCHQTWEQLSPLRPDTANVSAD